MLKKVITVLLAAVVATVAVAEPAFAGTTRFNQVSYGKCGVLTNQVYNSLSGYAVTDGVGGAGNYSKVDISTFKASGKFNLTSSCVKTPKKICQTLTLGMTAGGQIGTSAPFGAIGSYWSGKTTVGGQVASFAGSQKCQSVSSRSGAYTVTVPDGFFFFNSGYPTDIMDAKITLVTTFTFTDDSTVRVVAIADVA